MLLPARPQMAAPLPSHPLLPSERPCRALPLGALIKRFAAGANSIRTISIT